MTGLHAVHFTVGVGPVTGTAMADRVIPIRKNVIVFVGVASSDCGRNRGGQDLAAFSTSCISGGVPGSSAWWRSSVLWLGFFLGGSMDDYATRVWLAAGPVDSRSRAQLRHEA